jgi:hypothetical protein
MRRPCAEAANNTITGNQVCGGMGKSGIWVPREQGNAVNNTVSGNTCNGSNVDAGGGSSAVPLASREDVKKVTLPDNSKQKAEAAAAVANLAKSRQVLAQATATKLPSVSMSELRQQIAERNKEKCN